MSISFASHESDYVFDKSALSPEVLDNYYVSLDTFNIKENSIKFVTTGEIDGTIYVTIVLNDNSVLVVNDEEFSYSRVEDNELIIFSSNNMSQEKRVDLYRMLNDEDVYSMNNVLDSLIVPLSDEYIESYSSVLGKYFEYYFRETLTTRLVKLTITTGFLNQSTVSHINSTSSSNPEQPFESTADLFLYYLSNC